MKIKLPLLAVSLWVSLAFGTDFKIITVTKNCFAGSNKENYQMAKPESMYPLGSWLKTAEGSSMQVLFSAGNVFRLLPSSEIQVKGEGETHAKFLRVLQLKAGTVDLDLKALPKGTSINVETPTAVCGAVGTKFLVAAEEGKFKIEEGRIFIRSDEDESFSARSIAGEVVMRPGRDNGYASVSGVGSMTLNGVSVEASQPLTARIAKARGGSGMAAVKISGGTFVSSGSGEYLMEEGKLKAVDPDKRKLHADYLQAAAEEGDLNLKRASLKASGKTVPATLESDLSVAAARATKLRNELFARRVIRDTAREVNQKVMDQVTRSGARPR